MNPTLQRTETVDGVTLAFAVAGSGPTLVYMPGLPFSHMDAEWQVPSHRRALLGLADRVRLVQFDGRGTGRSQRDVDDVSLEAMIRDLDAVIEAVRADRVYLLGFYLSCAPAIAYAARHPERVAGLALFGGALRAWEAMESGSTQALLSLIERDWDTFVESAAHAWLGWPADVEGRLIVDWFRSATTPAVAREIMREASRIDVTIDAAAVRCPSLVLHRAGASVIPLAASQALAAALFEGRLEVIEGSSADLFAGAGEDPVQLIAEFVASGHPARAPGTGRRRQTRTGGPDSLSPRELEVLRLVAAGQSNAEIAHGLALSINTVERHITNLYRKIDARSRPDATAYAIRRGLA